LLWFYEVEYAATNRWYGTDTHTTVSGCRHAGIDGDITAAALCRIPQCPSRTET
jgi:hypothetical protein